MSRAIPQLNQRSSEVLRQIIDAYLETGEAVGSRTLSRNLGMELSPATIRNVMADLQDSGLLFSPHASAGRIPTEAGLRLFVDGLLEVGHLTEDERLTIEAQCAAEGRSVQQTLSEVTRVLSGLSNCAGLVVAPKSDSALRHIEFVSLAPGRALVVLVTEDGSVENRVVEVPNGMPASAMVEASNFLSARLVGKTIEEARGQIAAELELHRQDLDGLTQKLVEAGLATATGDGAEAALIDAWDVRRRVGEDAKLNFILRPTYPDLANGAETVAAAKGLKEAGAAGLAFYNYGHMALGSLDYVRDALAVFDPAGAAPGGENQ